MTKHKHTVGDGKVDTVEEVEEVVKSIFESRTVWVNLIALLAFVVQQKFGYVIDQNMQMEILTAVNIWLRSVTKDPVHWKKPKSKAAVKDTTQQEGV